MEGGGARNAAAVLRLVLGGGHLHCFLPVQKTWVVNQELASQAAITGGPRRSAPAPVTVIKLRRTGRRQDCDHSHEAGLPAVRGRQEKTTADQARFGRDRKFVLDHYRLLCEHHSSSSVNGPSISVAICAKVTAIVPLQKPPPLHITPMRGIVNAANREAWRTCLRHRNLEERGRVRPLLAKINVFELGGGHMMTRLKLAVAALSSLDLFPQPQAPILRRRASQQLGRIAIQNTITNGPGSRAIRKLELKASDKAPPFRHAMSPIRGLLCGFFFRKSWITAFVCRIVTTEPRCGRKRD